MEDIFLLLGANLGDRSANLAQARNFLQTLGSFKKLSSVYSTAPWGVVNQPDFYNQVLCLSTHIPPHELLTQLLSIEADMGRVRHEKWGSRVIDIDLLFYGSQVISNSDLTVPHPGIPHRRFTLVPLAEIAPAWIHPVLKKSMSELLQECPDMLEVSKVNG